MSKLGEFRKAIAAGLIAAGATVTTAMSDGTITTQEWIGVAIAALVAGLGVYAIPNADAAGTVTESSDDGAH